MRRRLRCGEVGAIGAGFIAGSLAALMAMGNGARRMVVRTLDSLLIARKKSSAEPSKNLKQTFFLSAAQYRNKFWLSLWAGLLACLNINAETPCGEK